MAYTTLFMTRSPAQERIMLPRSAFSAVEHTTKFGLEGLGDGVAEGEVDCDIDAEKLSVLLVVVDAEKDGEAGGVNVGATLELTVADAVTTAVTLPEKDTDAVLDGDAVVLHVRDGEVVLEAPKETDGEDVGEREDV